MKDIKKIQNTVEQGSHIKDDVDKVSYKQCDVAHQIRHTTKSLDDAQSWIPIHDLLPVTCLL